MISCKTQPTLYDDNRGFLAEPADQFIRQVGLCSGNSGLSALSRHSSSLRLPDPAAGIIGEATIAERPAGRQALREADLQVDPYCKRRFDDLYSCPASGGPRHPVENNA